MTPLSASQHFSLDNFEGPLELLLHLVLKSEINIFEVSIREITEQFLKLCEQWQEESLESGADALSTAATLLYVKSKTLLPKREQKDEEEEDPDDWDPRFNMIHQLLDYCRFKEAAKELAKKADEQTGYYYREGHEYTGPFGKPLGTNHLTVIDLAEVFKESLIAAENRFGDAIEEEVFRVADIMKAIRHKIKEFSDISLDSLFHPKKSKSELLVTFLATLELMKLGEIALIRDEDQSLKLIRQERHG